MLPIGGRAMELTCSQCHGASEVAEETNANSCVGCHTIGGYSLMAAIDKLVEAGHPNVGAMTETVPGDCLMCHKETLGILAHQLHLVESSTFSEHFPSGCPTCHVLGEEGAMTVEDLPIK